MGKRHILAAGLIAAAAMPAQAAFYVFGDSLVDSGVGPTAKPSSAPVGDGYYPGRYSNGYNFADYLAGAPRDPAQFNPVGAGGATAYIFGGDNFSVGGAATAERADDASPSFLEQIAEFEDRGITFAADDTILLTFGGNDIQTQLVLAAQGKAYDSVTAATTALQTGLGQLIALGARNITITGQADVGDIPKIQKLAATNPILLKDLPKIGTQLSAALNRSFGVVAKNASKTTDANVTFFNLLAFERSIVADPASVGLTDLDNPCKTPGQTYLTQPCGSSLYFDDIHPTTNVHGLIADAIQSGNFTSVPEPATWATMMLGFGLVGMAMRRRRRPVSA